MKTEQLESKIRFSIKIYPFLYGFNGDLIFWIIINSLFLTEVRHLTAAQINFLISVCTITALCIQPLIIPLIGRLGNLKSMRFGLFLMLCSMIILTLANHYYWIIIAYVIDASSSFFKSMENAILKKNLSYFSEEDNFMLIKNKGSLIYSIVTTIVALLAGFLFRVNVYLPMIIGIAVCAVNFLLSFLIYEYESVTEEKQEDVKTIFRPNKVILIVFILFGTLYPIITIGQDNCNLMIQYSLTEFLSQQKMITTLTIIIALSRVARIVGNCIILKLYKRFKRITLLFICIITMIALTLVLLGASISGCMQGVFLIALGLFIFLSIRDLVHNHLTTILLNNCNPQVHYKALSFFSLSRQIGQFIISSLFSLLLLKVNLSVIMAVSLVITILDLFIVLKFNKELK